MRASEHSTKQMHLSWLALSHWMTSIASNGPILYLKYMPTDVVALLWPGMWWGSLKAGPSRRLGLGEHSTKQLHTSWLALSHWMTSIASNGPIISLKYMPTGVVALLWPGMWWGSPQAGPSRRLGLVSIQLSKCKLVGWLCRIG